MSSVSLIDLFSFPLSVGISEYVISFSCVYVYLLAPKSTNQINGINGHLAFHISPFLPGSLLFIHVITQAFQID